MNRAAALSVLLLAATLPGIAAAQESSGSVAPPDVFRAVAVVRAELEILRFEMGRPLADGALLQVRNAAPREVLFQAQSLFEKAERLAFEHARQRASAPAAPAGEGRPADVLLVVDAALERLRVVKEEHQIATGADLPEREPERTPSDVFNSIVIANRQLNLLLDEQTSPSDVYQQVTRSVSRASRLLARFPGAERFPVEPAREPGQRPADVFDRLVACHARLQAIRELSGLRGAELELTGLEGREVSPGDVYDVASLLLAELSHFHSLLERAPPPPVYPPGRKFPADVDQRAGLLEAQLAELERRVRAEPDWLERRPAAR